MERPSLLTPRCWIWPAAEELLVVRSIARSRIGIARSRLRCGQFREEEEEEGEGMGRSGLRVRERRAGGTGRGVSGGRKRTGRTRKGREGRKVGK
jgi:hypothetical protein